MVEKYLKKRTSPNREMDVVVKKSELYDYLFEFKSYKWKSLPPSGFADQFSKDLLNGKLESLKDLKWYFDAQKLGGKTEAELVNFMTGAVREMWDGLDDPIKTIGNKYGVKDVGELIKLLRSNSVFKVR